MNGKCCRVCKRVLPASSFSPDKRASDGLSSRCKGCNNKRQAAYRNKNKEKIQEQDRIYRSKNKEKISARKRAYKTNNSEKISEYNKKRNAKYKKEKRKEVMAAQADYRERNRELLREKQRERLKNNPDKARDAYLKRRSNPRNRIRDSISRAINYSLKGMPKGGRWDGLVGYDIETLRRHLEKQFLPGMTWENYGTHGWHIDHIIPVSAFNYSSTSHIDFQRCWALSNLRPLWARDNLSKKDKLLKPFQPALQI